MAVDFSKAKCIGLTELFFDEDNQESMQRAKEVCSTCPIIRGCLTESLMRRESYGLWGGATFDERRAIAIMRGMKPPTRKKEVEHGTTRGYDWHKRTGTPIERDEQGNDKCGCATANREASRIRMAGHRERKRSGFALGSPE